MKPRPAGILLLLLAIWAHPVQTRAESSFTKIIVPNPAGSAPDTVARIIAGPLSAKLGQSILVENKAGAGERIGAEIVAHAPPDGHTLLLAPPGSLVLAQSLFANLRYDPSAFEPVGVLTSGTLVLLTRQNLAVSSVAQLVRMATEEAGKLTYASPGVGTPPHLAGEMFRLAASINVTHVPYKGLTPALADLLAGRVDFMFDNLGNSIAHIKAGRVKALAVASDVRAPELSDVPAIADTYPAVRAASWFGVVAPPNTPPNLCARLSRALAEIVTSPEVQARLQAMALHPVGSAPGEMEAFLKEERERWGAVVRKAEVRP